MDREVVERLLEQHAHRARPARDARSQRRLAREDRDGGALLVLRRDRARARERHLLLGPRVLGRDRHGIRRGPDLRRPVDAPGPVDVHRPAARRTAGARDLRHALLGRTAGRGRPQAGAAASDRGGGRARGSRPGCRPSTSSTSSARTIEQPPFGGTPITTTLTNQRLPVLQQLVRHLKAFGLSPRTLNHEWGPTQYELTFGAVEGLAAGDDNFTYKTYAKEIAAQHGLIASFMTKPFAGQSGSSSHLHTEPVRRRSQHLLGRRRRAC